jgi:prepilin-type N-terminal cleavage/methylation domain-containing protein
MKKNKQGFTLIELLVVIAIIGLLATLSIVALNTARARSRDAKRVADVKQVQTALELYFNDNGAYPATVISGGTIASTTNVYMGIVPTAPTPADSAACSAANAYAYTMTSYNGTAGGSYTLTYCLGQATGNIPAGVGTATPASIR